jgi:prepilin peptidase CpaA
MVPVASIAVAAVACVTDLRARRIPNALTFSAALAGLAAHAIVGGARGLAMAAAGWGVGLLLFLPLFALRGIGGGDVKLLAALGAWLGPRDAFWLACWSAVAGGVFAVFVAMAHGYTRRAVANVWSMVAFWRIMGVRPHPTVTLETARGPRLPYSLPIAVGLGITLWVR